MTKLAAAGRWAGTRFCALSATLLVLATGNAWSAPSRAAVSVSRQDANSVVFRVHVPEAVLKPSASLSGAERLAIDGYYRLGAPGEPPTLSRAFLVGLPEAGAYSVSFRVITSASLGTHRLEPVATPVGIHDEDLGPGLSERVVWDDAVFRAYRSPALVSGDPVVYMRQQRVLPVRLNPVSYDPQTQSLAVATEIEVEVRFSAPPSSASSAPANEGKLWKDISGKLLVNADQASRWPVTKEAPAENLSVAASRVAAGAIKIRVRQTAIHTVRASRAISAGFPAGQPIAGLRLFRRLYSDASLTPSETEIAFDVNEDAAGTAGVFDGADELVFYGKRLRDDPTQGDVRENFSASNIYWLEPNTGTPMVQRTPGVGFVTADTLALAFPVSANHFETDHFFRDNTPANVPDLYYYNGGFEPGPVDMPFAMGYPKPGTNVTLTGELHNQTYSDPLVVHVALFNSKGEQSLDPVPPLSIPGRTRSLFSASVPGTSFDPGDNQFRINRPDASRSALNIYLNFVEVSYTALFRARGNMLRFNSAALSGDTTLTVTGITSTSGLELFDITNADQPERLVLTAGHFQPADGGTALSFRVSLSGPGRREYLLVPEARMVDVPQSDLAGDTPSSIIGSSAESGVDVLVVSHHDFMPGMRGWAAYRRAQGYRVLLADVEDVFDEFNGGVANARAVQRFARHFYTRGGAEVLVLVGDSSEDHKRIHEDSGPDFVPTFTRIDNVASLQADEVVTTDKRLVKFPGPGGQVDAVPDMIVGRIPVGDPGELESVLGKVYLYEAPQPSDFWRKRMILVADDAFSEGGDSQFGGIGSFCYHSEEGFELGQEDVAQVMENSLPAGYEIVRFYLSDYTDNFYPPPGPQLRCANRFAAITYVRQNVTERLMSELNKGATWVAIQAHMNRYVITHERLLSGEPASILNSPTGRDYLRVENRSKPWIIFGMGCHFSEFAINREFAPDRLIYNSPNGDCFAEQYLSQNERGAVGTYGSSGFEYLTENMDYMSTIARVWFYGSPYEGMVDSTQAEWKFGELMYLAEAEMVTTRGPNQPGQPEPVERYHILGDPLLRIDAGPPAFDVTVNGRPAQNGDLISGGGEEDSISVVAVVTDENALHKFSLEIEGRDVSDSLTVVRLVDPGLPHARQYRVSFRHVLQPRTYDIVLRAYQSPDTTAGQYHMAAEFTLKVESSISVSVNGRAIQSGAPVPADGNYRIDLGFPVFIPQSAISVSIDDDLVTDAQYSHPSPEDSLAWVITFRKKLAAGDHQMRVAAEDIEFLYQLTVSETTGLDHVINFPNPFRTDGTRFVYTNEVEITDGNIDIFTVSGKKVRRLPIPSTARPPGQNTVFWDGRDQSGGSLANGTYLYVINVKQRGGSATVRGATTKIE